jgi:hypothetical protein
MPIEYGTIPIVRDQAVLFQQHPESRLPEVIVG